MFSPWIFAGLIAAVIAGIFFMAWLVKTRTKIPARVRLQKLEPEPEDTVPVQAYYESELAALEFEKVGEFTVTGLDAGNVHRVYLNKNESSLAVVSSVSTAGRRRPHLEFYTRFDDRSTLSTEGAATPNFLATPPARQVHRLPANLSAENLWQFHKRKVEAGKTAGRAPMALAKNTVYEIIEQDQQELVDFQVQNGLFRRAQDEATLVPAWKFAFYFLFKVLDPMPSGISAPKFAAAVLAGAAVLFGFFMLARWRDAPDFFAAMNLTEPQLRYAISAAGAALAGALIGYLLQTRGVLWAGIIALAQYFLVKSAFPNAYAAILICAYAGLVGNRISEYQISRMASRFLGPVIVLAGLIIFGWVLLEK